jgi:3-deoxy-manno-octulosonate cytidylyltransferase (CMP-KDO synthetase)
MTDAAMPSTGVDPGDFVVAIPARFGASRLPGKPLREIAGEPMIVHVARRALAAGAAQVVVATDDARIGQAVAGLPLTVVMTRAGHLSGTDRLAECAARLRWAPDLIVVNLQGDEPFAPPEGIRAVARTLRDAAAGTEMATLALPVDDSAVLFEPNAVKVVCDTAGHALYFSRAPIPWNRDRFVADRLSPPAAGALRHIGIYAYRARFLERFADFPRGRLERSESLEQLRVLEAGERIAVGISPVPFPSGVDTPEDLARADAQARAAAGTVRR